MVLQPLTPNNKWSGNMYRTLAALTALLIASTYANAQNVDAPNGNAVGRDNNGSMIVNPKPDVVVTYRVCSGEYERACQQHDAYLYCAGDVKSWADSRCSSYVVQRVNTYGGNKCGYSIDAVICHDPK
jgi:hypothetical protein